MSIISDRAFSTFHSLDASVQEMQDLLREVLQRSPADAACIYEAGRDYQPQQPLIIVGEIEVSTEDQQRLHRTMRDFAEAARSDEDDSPAARMLGSESLTKTPFRSAALYPLRIGTHLLGVLGLFSIRADAYSAAVPEGLSEPLRTAHLILENNYLKGLVEQNLAAAQSILATAQAIAESPSPQQIVNILHDTLFDGHISSCAMLLFGPVREGEPHGPFEYLEIKGT